MALVVFLRGVNVGGHRTFRPTVLANALRKYDVVNVGAAGTFVVRKPGPRTRFLADLRRKLPFETHVAVCDGRDLLGLMTSSRFAGDTPRPGIVRFISVLASKPRVRPDLPVHLPPSGQWLVRVIECTPPFVFGEYRRHMKTIGYLGQIDRLFDVPITTRNWNTMVAIAKVLDGPAGVVPPITKPRRVVRRSSP